MNYVRVTGWPAATMFLAIAPLGLIPSLEADSILPTATFSCTGATCSGTTTQLPSVNGVQGLEIDFQGHSTSTTDSTFQFGVAGTLAGDSLPAGTVISFTYSFTAESPNTHGTQITSDSFVVPPFAAFTVTGQSETITSDAPCIPDPPDVSQWCRSVIGSGLLEFPTGLASGSPLDLGAQITIDTDNAAGLPAISLNGVVDFNAMPVPEPRLPGLVLAVIALLAAQRRRRTALTR